MDAPGAGSIVPEHLRTCGGRVRLARAALHLQRQHLIDRGAAAGPNGFEHEAEQLGAFYLSSDQLQADELTPPLTVMSTRPLSDQ